MTPNRAAAELVLELLYGRRRAGVVLAEGWAAETAALTGVDRALVVAATACGAAPAELWDELATLGPTGRILTAVHGPERFLTELATNPMWSVHLGLMYNPATSGDIIAELIRHTSVKVERQAIEHPNCPPATLAELAATNGLLWAAGPAIVDHPNSTVEVLETIAANTTGFSGATRTNARARLTGDTPAPWAEPQPRVVVLR